EISMELKLRSMLIRTKQSQYQPLPLTYQVSVNYAGTNGLLDNIPVDRITQWKEDFLRAYNTQFADIANQIQENPNVWNDEIAGRLRQAIETFNANWN